MRRIVLKLSYDGTNYHGWQVQENAVTVQETLQIAAEKMFGFLPAIHGCSRTDAGVHANEYFCHFDIENDIDCKSIRRGLNTYLPNDIAVTDVFEKDASFHARYSAKSKEYVYQIYNSDIPNPFFVKYYLTVSKKLNEERMERVLKCFRGVHDFKGFCNIKTSVNSTVREIYDTSVKKYDKKIFITIKGDGFLYNMVRIIIGTVLFVEMGIIDEKDIPGIIDAQDRTLAGKTVVPKGLYLNKVEY